VVLEFIPGLIREFVLDSVLDLLLGVEPWNVGIDSSLAPSSSSPLDATRMLSRQSWSISRYPDVNVKVQSGCSRSVRA
jgi:hypothetical protein